MSIFFFESSGLNKKKETEKKETRYWSSDLRNRLWPCRFTYILQIRDTTFCITNYHIYLWDCAANFLSLSLSLVEHLHTHVHTYTHVECLFLAKEREVRKGKRKNEIAERIPNKIGKPRRDTVTKENTDIPIGTILYEINLQQE